MHKNLQDIQTESVNCAAAQLELPVFVLHSEALLFLNFEWNRVAQGHQDVADRLLILLKAAS